MVKQIAPTTATNTRGISEIAITTGNAIRHKATQNPFLFVKYEILRQTPV